MKFLRDSRGELIVDGANARMRKLLQSERGREKLAELIVQGDGKFYSRAEIRIRIQKMFARIAERLTA